MMNAVVEENQHLFADKKYFVNKNEEEEFEVKGFQRRILHTIFFYLLGCLSVGIIFLLGYWYPVRRLKYTHQRCCLSQSTSILIKQSSSKQNYVTTVSKTPNQQTESKPSDEFSKFEQDLVAKPALHYFEHMFLRYYFNQEFTDIQPVFGLDNTLTSHQIHGMSHGISSATAKVKKVIHKLNIIDIPMKSYFVVFIQLAANPFYVFQVASCTLWYTDDYAYYATLILVMTLISLIVTTYETKQNMKKLHDMVGGSIKVQVIRDHVVQTIDSYYLVPGDVLVIPDSGIDIPCDAVLLSGRCVVNESSLTGESFPNTKTAIDDLVGPKGDTLVYSVTKHKRHTLYNGTTVLEAHKYGGDEKVLSLVIRTGFCTLKGGLIRSIIHPKPIQFAFFRDSMKFIMVFAFIAFCGFIYTIVLFVRDGAKLGKIVRKSLDLFTIAIPPALPACMSVGVMSAIRHLKHFQIFCIDPSRINLCGKIKLFVFDKTGTLTEDTLCVGGVVTAEATFHQNNQHLKDTQMIQAMSTCHGLNIIDEKSCGDPLDLSMFEFTNAQLSAVSSNDKSEEHPYMLVTPCLGSLSEEPVGIYKQYMFESSLQRMSVVTKQHDDLYRAFVKGSPEMIMSLCKIDSIPSSIHDVLHQYTHQGCRVLALATKELSKDITWSVLKKLPRNQVECQLQFLGLIIFQNDIKVETLPTIETLQEANIRCIMATGDNLLTAARVARNVNIIKEWQQTIQVTAEDNNVLHYQTLDAASINKDDKEAIDIHLTQSFEVGTYMKGLEYSLVMTGDVYCQIKEHFPELHSKVLLSTLVYARMSPDQKAVLIEDLKELGYGVGMCAQRT